MGLRCGGGCRSGVTVGVGRGFGGGGLLLRGFDVLLGGEVGVVDGLFGVVLLACSMLVRQLLGDVG